MRTLLFIALGTLVAFAAGLAGTYFVLPMVAPDVAEAQRMRADSLARVDSLALADSLVQVGGPPQIDGLSLPDSLVGTGDLAGADSSLAATDSLFAAGAVRADAPTALRDSLDVLRRRLADYEAQIAAFETQITTTNAQRVQASDLAGTLIKLEDRELARVLSNLDLDVLELLYAESSARNRARLLGALDPARTALFIRRATSSGPTPTPAPDLATEQERTEQETTESEANASTPR